MNPWTVAAISLASFGLGIAFAAWRGRNKPTVVSDDGKSKVTAIECAERIAHETRRAKYRGDEENPA